MASIDAPKLRFNKEILTSKYSELKESFPETPDPCLILTLDSFTDESVVWNGEDNVFVWKAAMFCGLANLDVFINRVIPPMSRMKILAVGVDTVTDVLEVSGDQVLPLSILRESRRSATEKQLFMNLLTNVSKEIQEARLAEFHVVLGTDGQFCDASLVISKHTIKLPAIRTVVDMCWELWLHKCGEQASIVTPSPSLKMITHMLATTSSAFCLSDLNENAVSLFTISMASSCKGTQELLHYIIEFCTGTKGMYTFLERKSDEMQGRVLEFIEFAFCVITKIKSIDLFLQQKKLEGESDPALLIKAIAVLLKLHVEKKTDSDYFNHPEHMIIREFVCAVFGVMAFCGSAIFLEETNALTFEFQETGEFSSCRFYEDRLNDPNYKEDEVLNCANSLTWGTGCSTIGCPVSVMMSSLPPVAVKESVRAFGESDFWGMPTCSWLCYHSAVDIMMTEGVIENKDEVKSVQYKECGLIFISKA